VVAFLWLNIPHVSRNIGLPTLPWLNWSHVWHTNEMATSKHRAFDALHPVYPQNKRKPESCIFTSTLWLPSYYATGIILSSTKTKQTRSVILSWIPSSYLPNITVSKIRKKKQPRETRGQEEMRIWVGVLFHCPGQYTGALSPSMNLHFGQLELEEIQKTPKIMKTKSQCHSKTV